MNEGVRDQGRVLAASLEDALEKLINAAKTARQNIAAYPVKAELTNALLIGELALANYRTETAHRVKETKND